MLAGDWVFHTSTARGAAYSPVEPIGGGEWSAAVAKSCRRDRKVRYVVVPPGTGVGIASRVCTDNVTAQINESVLAPLVRTKTTPLRVVEAAAMCTAYRAKYGVGTQVARPAVSAMTLAPIHSGLDQDEMAALQARSCLGSERGATSKHGSTAACCHRRSAADEALRQDG